MRASRIQRLLGYADDWLSGLPEAGVASFAGTGNPFSLGTLGSGEQVVDVGCGAGLDSCAAILYYCNKGGIYATWQMHGVATSCHNRGDRPRAIGLGRPCNDTWSEMG